ncbi:MAG: anthranilate phosphoribosyltransferase [Zavarzinella sp.]
MDPHQLYLNQLLDSKECSTESLQLFLNDLLHHRIEQELAAAILIALRVRGETGEELAAAAQLLRSMMHPLSRDERTVADTCGTGGDNSHTFNISTATAFVAAASGVRIAKHGNRAVSSTSGSSDVLSALGINVESGIRWAEKTLRDNGIAFCFAPHYHPSMAAVAGLRAKLKTRTIFNLLGPLLNPASADYQILGVGRPELANRLAKALWHSTIKRAFVLHSRDGLDEISLAAPTDVIEVIPGYEIIHHVWNEGDFGLPAVPREAILVHSAIESATLITDILHGKACPARDVVLANSAALLYLVGACKSLAEGTHLTLQSIQSGAAWEKVRALAASSSEKE